MEIYGRPRNEFVAEFLGMRNGLSCKVTEAQELIAESGSAPLPHDFIAPGTYRLRSRPTELAIRPANEETSAPHHVWVPGGRVVNSMHYGSLEEYCVAIGSETVMVERKAAAPLPPGTEVDLGINLEAVRFYDMKENLVDARYGSPAGTGIGTSAPAE